MPGLRFQVHIRSRSSGDASGHSRLLQNTGTEALASSCSSSARRRGPLHHLTASCRGQRGLPPPGAQRRTGSETRKVLPVCRAPAAPSPHLGNLQGSQRKGRPGSGLACLSSPRGQAALTPPPPGSETTPTLAEAAGPPESHWQRFAPASHLGLRYPVHLATASATQALWGTHRLQVIPCVRTQRLWSALLCPPACGPET